MPKKITNNWKKYKRKEFVIIGYLPNDKYEFPQKVYLSLKEMADDLCININHVNNILTRESVYQKTKLKYLKVRCN